MRSAILRAISVVLALAAAAGAWAQYPTKPVTMIVPFAAGGPTDTVARSLGVAMQNTLKQTVLVENVGGAGGTIGVGRVAKASPDGYTILLHHIGMATAPALYRKLTFDPLKDFEYIGLVNDVPMTMIARANFPPNNFKEFLAYIKANKGEGHLRERGPRRRVAPLRTAVHEHDRGRLHHRAVQGHRAGDE